MSPQRGSSGRDGALPDGAPPDGRPGAAASPGRAAVVAVDGPSGSGKSTVSRRVAAALDLPYVDSGATYRALTLGVLRAGVEPTDAAAVEELTSRLTVSLGTDADSPHVDLDGQRVDAEVRGEDVTAAVSAVSALPAVRRRMVELQRGLAARGAVVEGRDIGTTVCPDAAVKVFLVADPDERARRRGSEQGTADHGAVGRSLAARDAADSSRAASPLRAAPDAVRLDTTALDVDEVVAQVLALCDAAGVVR